MYSRSTQNPTSKHRYARRFSFDIDNDLSNASKLRKNSLTGRSAALDIVLNANSGVLNKQRPRQPSPLTTKRSKTTKPKRISNKSNLSNNGVNLEIDDDVLKDFERLYNDAINRPDNSSPADCSEKPALDKISLDTEYANLTNALKDLTENINQLELTKEETQSLEESEQDIELRRKYTLYRYKIIPDGNCLYRAIAQAVYTDDDYHAVLRQATVSYIKNHIDEFKDILEGPVDEYLTKAEEDCEWAGYPEILAMTRLLNININITTGGSVENPKVSTTCHYYYKEKEKRHSKNGLLLRQRSTTRPTVWVSWLSSGHYDLLTDAKLPNLKYDAWEESVMKQTSLDEAMAIELSKQDSRTRLSRIATSNCRNDHSNKPLKAAHLEAMSHSSNASLQSLSESCTNSDFTSAFDFDILKHSDLYA